MVSDGNALALEPTMASVIAQFGRGYLARFGARMPKVQIEAMEKISWCRTMTLGGHLLTCRCGEALDYVYHSCNHRSCPKCGGQQTAAWVEKRERELLSVPYFHLVVTVPEQLRRTIRTHQRFLYEALMRSVQEGVQELTADRKHLGAMVAQMAILHTWTQTEEYHPHVHVILSCGGVDPAGNWVDADPNWLFPDRALARLVRGKFVRRAREAVPGITIPESVFKRDWLVHMEPAQNGTGRIVKYIARYIHRTGISDHRILRVTESGVKFRYRSRDRKKMRTMTLPGEEFLRRFLQHVLEKGFHRVRYCGLWSPGRRVLLMATKERLANRAATSTAPGGASEGDGREQPTATPGGASPTSPDAARGGGPGSRAPEQRDNPGSGENPEGPLKETAQRLPAESASSAATARSGATWLTCPRCGRTRTIVLEFKPIPLWARAGP